MVSINKCKYFMSVYFILSYFALNFMSYISKISVVKYVVIFILDFFFIFCLGGFRKVRLNSTLSLYIYYQIYLITMTIINGFTIGNCQSSLQMCLSLLLIKCIIKDDGIKPFLNAAYDINGVLIPLNLVICVIFPDGVLQSASGVPIYLMGNRNTMGSSIILLIILSLIYINFENTIINKKIIFTIICGFLSCIVTWTATNIVCFLVLFIFLFLSNSKYLNLIINKMKLKHTLIFGIVLFFLIDVFQMLSIFSHIIENVLHKSITLSARTYIWDVVSALFINKPLMGYGYYDSIILANNYFTPANAHSFFWEILLSGGIIGLLLIMIIISRFAKSLKSINKDSVVRILCIYFLMIMVDGITESSNLNIGLYIMMILAEEVSLNPYPK